MDGKEVINDIRQAINEVKSNDQDVISTGALLDYLDNLESYASDSNNQLDRRHEFNIAEYKASNDRGIAQYNANISQTLESFRSTIAYGASALKSAILINGGGAVAILAFIGNIWNKGILPESPALLADSALYFSFGVLFAAIGVATAYATQYLYLFEYRKTGIMLHISTILLVFGSYVFFGFGSFEAYHSFHNKW